MAENLTEHAIVQQAMDNGVLVHEIGFRAHGAGVVMALPKLADYVYLDADTARQAAEQLGRCAYEAHFGNPPPNTTRSVITEMKVQTLRRRVALMLSSFMREGKLSGDPDVNRKVAESIVDTVLSEAL